MAVFATPSGHCASQTLSGLPTELLLETFSKLSTRNICRVRGVSKTMKAIVDENITAITLPTILLHQYWIKSVYRKLLKPGPIRLAEVFRRYLRYYGKHRRDGVMQKMCAVQMTARYVGMPQDSQAWLNLGTSIHLERVLQRAALTDNIPSWHSRRDWYLSDESRQRAQELLVRLAEWTGDRSLKDALRSVEELMRTTTPRDWEPHPGLDLNIEGRDLRAQTEVLATEDGTKTRHMTILLGIKCLPVHSGFWYCLKSPAIRDLLVKRLKGPPGQTTMLERAAILEELFIW